MNPTTPFLSIVLFGICVSLLLAVTGCGSLQSEYCAKVTDAFTEQPLVSEHILTESRIAHLPLPVRRYIAYSGALGKSIPQNMRIEFEAQMIKSPGADPIRASSEQYNFFGTPTRLFLMKASKFLLPFHALHIYKREKATFVVRVASMFNAVDIAGSVLSETETVTLLNDMCLFAPGSLCDQRLSWEELDSLSARVTLRNGPYAVSGVLSFGDNGELVNFVSEDRAALQDDGTLKKSRWSTPVRDYKHVGGRMIPSYGQTIWHYPEGEFLYGTFTLKNITYNAKTPD